MYRRNAEEVKSALLAAHPELTVELNPEKPRKKTFEITLLEGGKGEEGGKGKPENNSTICCSQGSFSTMCLYLRFWGFCSSSLVH